MRWIVLFILFIPLLHAKTNLNFSSESAYYTNLNISMIYKRDATKVSVHDDRFNIDQNFVYINDYLRTVIDGSFGHLKYDLSYQKSVDDDIMQEYTVFVGNEDLRLIWIGSANTENAYSHTTESNFGFWAIFDVRNKRYELFNDQNLISFDARISKLTTEHVFWALAKRGANSYYDNFNYLWLAFAKKGINYKAYGTVYYAFTSLTITNLKHIQGSIETAQHEQENIDGNGFTTGYKAEVMFGDGNLQGSFFLRIEKTNFEATNNNIPSKQMQFLLDKSDISFSGSISYKF